MYKGIIKFENNEIINQIIFCVLNRPYESKPYDRCLIDHATIYMIYSIWYVVYQYICTFISLHYSIQWNQDY